MSLISRWTTDENVPPMDSLQLNVIRCYILTQSLVELVGSGDKSEKRASKLSASMAASPGSTFWAYNKAARSDPVDMEDALNAEHCVEFARGTQFCARAICSVDGRNMRSDDDFMVSHLAQTGVQRCAIPMSLFQRNE